MIYIQPYYFWRGHYKIYTDSMFNKKDDILICVDSKNTNKKNILVKKPYMGCHNRNILNFIISRILNYISCISLILQKSVKFKKKEIHFLEFEPFSFFLFLLLNLFLKKKFFLTIHSTGLINKNNIFLFLIQRLFFFFVITLLNFCNCKIIVHKKQDYDRIRFFFKKSLYLLDYPSPKPNYIKKNYRGNLSMLVAGQVRKDKNYEKIIHKAIKDNFKITIAGSVMYNFNYWKKLHTIRKITLINKFINKKNLEKLVAENDFILLPYGKNYSGSAGPLKDSLSYGQPVICSNLKQFRSFLSKHKVGYLYTSNLKNRLGKMNSKEYNLMRKNCIVYSRENNFENFRSKHSKIYN